jgi:uncharacterized integral membrane protein
MYISIISIFVLILGTVILSLQNNTSLELSFLAWKFEMSFAALVFYLEMVGGAIIAVIILPKLVIKSFKVKSLNRGINTLKKKTEGLEKNKEWNLPDI